MDRFFYTWKRFAKPCGTVWAENMQHAADDLLRDHPHNDAVWIQERVWRYNWIEYKRQDAPVALTT